MRLPFRQSTNCCRVLFNLSLVNFSWARNTLNVPSRMRVVASHTSRLTRTGDDTQIFTRRKCARTLRHKRWELEARAAPPVRLELSLRSCNGRACSATRSFSIRGIVWTTCCGCRGRGTSTQDCAEMIHSRVCLQERACSVSVGTGGVAQ